MNKSRNQVLKSPTQHEMKLSESSDEQKQESTIEITNSTRIEIEHESSDEQKNTIKI